MAVFRIEKTRDYTVMSNHHLKDRTLTLKSKGLLSMMLSLPDEWNYTTRGLAAICREGVDSIGAALKELETHGYIRRTQLRDEKGKITDTEYVIYEMPQCEPPSSPGTPLPGTAKPYTENPDMGIPDTAEPCTENPAQLNTNQTKTDLSSTEISNPIQSNPPTPAGARMGTDRMGARECYREVILDNIEYSYLVQDSHIDREQLDEIVDLIVDTVTYTTPDGMKCRDNKLHEEKYCKETMEREFRIRAEVVSARTQAAQLPADSAAGADTTFRSASHESGLGANDERSGYTVVPCGSADGSVGEHQQTDVAASHTDAVGRSSEDGAASGADERTGWEAERELFFSAQNQTSQTAPTTHQYSGIDLSANGGGSTASALVGLGHRLEQLQPVAPVMPARHYTDRKALQKEREKKIALGHKADDHEDEVSYDWQQTM